MEGRLTSKYVLTKTVKEREKMNKQGKDGIEYLDYTFNPIGGCKHVCKDSYCYAAKIAKRFGGNTEHEYHGLHILDRPMYKKTKAGKLMVDPYPYGFEPTFHKYRLNEPAEKKKPSIIGVVYMGDLFGEWVPDSWIQEVFKACEAAPQHTYMFLTKNSGRYEKIINNGVIEVKDNYWFGTTVTTADGYAYARGQGINTFASIEPIMGEFKGTKEELLPDWVIIGVETGNRKDKVIPRKEWIENIISGCKAANVPVFVKSPLYQQFPIQEWPDDLRKEMAR